MVRNVGDGKIMTRDKERWRGKWYDIENVANMAELNREVNDSLNDKDDAIDGKKWRSTWRGRWHDMGEIARHREVNDEVYSRDSKRWHEI
jgi:NDP-sugar pyrophosphorylase family protein